MRSALSSSERRSSGPAVATPVVASSSTPSTARTCAGSVGRTGLAERCGCRSAFEPGPVRPLGHGRRQRVEVVGAPALERHRHGFADAPARVVGVRAQLAERLRVPLGEQSAQPDHPAEGEELPSAARGLRSRVERRPAPQLRRVAKPAPRPTPARCSRAAPAGPSARRRAPVGPASRARTRPPGGRPRGPAPRRRSSCRPLPCPRRRPCASAGPRARAPRRWVAFRAG